LDDGGQKSNLARCMELKDTMVGHTDESGVKLPPLHPRCRCTIMYREIEPPKPLTNSLSDEKITLNINDFGEAHIPMAKLTKYALDSEKAPDKAFAFEKALGYNLGNVDKLVENIKRNVNNYEFEMFDKVLLKTGETAYIVEIYEQGVAYEADIDRADGTIETDTIQHADIEKILK